MAAITLGFAHTRLCLQGQGWQSATALHLEQTCIPLPCQDSQSVVPGPDPSAASGNL